MSRFFYAFIVYFLFWVAFTTSLDWQELLAGGFLALILAYYTGKEFSEGGMSNFSLRRIVYAFRYIFVFIWEMIKANVDVARRVLSPKIPLNPGIIEIRTTLKTNVAKLALANSITLTPGTLTVDILDDKLYIHWIYVHTKDPEEAYRMIAAVFEKYIREIWE